MKKQSKKLLSLFLAVIILFTLLIPASALDEEDLQSHYENGYQFYVTETEDGPVLTDVHYVGRINNNSNMAFLPETLGGLPVTPDVIDGYTFISLGNSQTLRVSADNPYFKTIDGSLFSKDGKTLFYLSNRTCDSIIVVPEGVETIREAAVNNANCVILPDSVNVIENELEFNLSLVIAANTGTTAQTFALENNCKFIPLNKQ